MKRYLLFTYLEYYPQGGWNDFIGAYDSIEEIKNLCFREISNVEIVDLKTLKVVAYKASDSIQWILVSD